MKLELVHKNNQLFHIIHNEGDEEIKFWDNNNSWGWGNIQIIVKTSQQEIIITQKLKIFTRNGPSYIIIPPNSTYEYGLNINKENWEYNLTSENEETEIFSKIIIKETKESQELGVFTGTLKSNTLKIKDNLLSEIFKI